MTRSLFPLLPLLLSGLGFTDPVLGQVVFSPAHRPSPTPDSVAGSLPISRLAFRVTYFDSTRLPKTQPVARSQVFYDRVDSLLAQAADSLLGDKSRRNHTDKSFMARLQFVPAIPPVRYDRWQDYRVSSRFGWRQHPIGGDTRLHNGLDLPQPTGTAVFATADGIVKWVCWQPDGLGLGVCIEHPTGYQSIYGHLSAYSVRKGDAVLRGMQIGRVGSSGRSTGPHLHYAVQYRGQPVDPARYCFLWLKLARSGY